jgi:hypothetical protein
MTYAVRPLRLDEDRDALGRLWAENMSDAQVAAVLPRRLRWLYEGSVAPVTTMVCVHVESGDLVGCGSYFERSTWIDGRSARSGVLCDFAVARLHRTGAAAIGIQRALADAARETGLALLYGYPNPRSRAVLERVGYRVVGETTSWSKPLRCGYKLRERLGARAGRAAALPLDVALTACDGLRWAAACVRWRGEHVARPDARADELWERGRPGYDVIGEKPSAYLDWRYRGFTTAEHRIFAIGRRGDARHDAYAVYTVEGGKASVRDLFADRLDRSAGPVLLALARLLRSEGADALSLSYLGPPRFAAVLRRLGFLRRPGRRALVLHPELVPEPMRARAFDPASWFMLDGELDI